MSDLVLVTGIDGFIGKHVALTLLEQGYRVRGSLLAAARAEAVRAALAASNVDASGLEFVEADLLADDGWSEMMQGCSYVLHVASPFPPLPPKDREALVPVAREGALRVFDAAHGAGVKRIVVTSSLVAMMYRKGRAAEAMIGEADWSDPEWGALNAYMVSKTRAERALWAHAKELNVEGLLTTINPALVLGPALDDEVGASLGIVKMIMTGENPAVTPTAHPVVDVRDVAALHVAAMTAEAAGGRRLIASADTLKVEEMADALRQAFPDLSPKIPKMVLPPFMVRAMALFIPGLRTVMPDLGVRATAETGYVTDLTGVTFRPAREAVVATGQSLLANGVVSAPTPGADG